VLRAVMADNDAAPGAMEVQTLKTTDAHASGTVSAVWLAPKESGQLSVLTAGSDGVLSERQIRPTQEVKWKTTVSRQHPVTALSLSPDQTMGVVVVNKTHVKVTCAANTAACSGNNICRDKPAQMQSVGNVSTHPQLSSARSHSSSGSALLYMTAGKAAAPESYHLLFPAADDASEW
jgi:hypothetical protein